MSPIPISLQMYSLRDDAQKDFAGTAAKVAEIGYAGVEMAGYGNLSANEAAEALKACGLRCSGMHVSLEQLRGSLTQVMTDAHLFATRDLICSWYPPVLLNSKDAFIALGEELDAHGARLRQHGFRLHYHNHDAEWRIFEGRAGFDWMLDAARPANLLCEPDVYWVEVGGGDPGRFLREQGRRVRLLHLKDEKEIGTGPVDFPAVFAAVDAVGTLEWCVVEVEHYNHEPLESVRRSFEQLRAWGRV